MWGAHKGHDLRRRACGEGAISGNVLTISDIKLEGHNIFLTGQHFYFSFIINIYSGGF